MAFTLDFSVVERNDNKLITVTDTTGIYHAVTNPTGWDATSVTNPSTTDVTASGGADPLELDIVYTASDGTVTTYDTIDLFILFAGGSFVDVGDLVFPLTCAMLKVSTVAIGTATDEFADGVYEITYVYDGPAGADLTTTTSTILIDGQVRNAVYELLRALPDNYTAPNCYEKETLDIIFMSTLLDSMEASTLSAREQSVLDQLYTLERLVTNVSTYVW
jgi:hypothetical protein